MTAHNRRTAAQRRPSGAGRANHLGEDRETAYGSYCRASPEEPTGGRDIPAPSRRAFCSQRAAAAGNRWAAECGLPAASRVPRQPPRPIHAGPVPSCGYDARSAGAATAGPDRGCCSPHWVTGDQRQRSDSRRSVTPPPIGRGGGSGTRRHRSRLLAQTSGLNGGRGRGRLSPEASRPGPPRRPLTS